MGKQKRVEDCERAVLKPNQIVKQKQMEIIKANSAYLRDIVSIDKTLNNQKKKNTKKNCYYL